MLSSTGQQLPRLPLGAIAISQQECEVIQSIQKHFFFVSRSGEWQRHLSFIQCYYLYCSHLSVNWLLGYEPNPKAAEKFHNCKPSPSLGFQVKPTRMILQLKSDLQVMPATSQLNSMYILYLLLDHKANLPIWVLQVSEEGKPGKWGINERRVQKRQRNRMFKVPCALAMPYAEGVT